MVKIKGIKQNNLEIEAIKEALKTKNLISDADLIIAKDKLKQKDPNKN